MYDIDLANRLRRWLPADRVVEIDGWQERGYGNFFGQGAVDHHTAGGAHGAAPSLNACIYGFAGSAPGPLCNVLQSREEGEGNDKAYVIAGGTANHAGYGGWRGIAGNSSVWGLEVEHVGTEPLPQHRHDTAQLITAGFVDGTTDGEMTCQHFEWSGYGDGSKIDIATGIDANDWRRRITAILHGGGGTPPPDTDTEGYSEEIMLLVALDRDGMFAKKGHLYLLDSLGAVDLDPEPASSFNRTPQGVVKMSTLDALIGDRIKRGIELGLIK